MATQNTMQLGKPVTGAILYIKPPFNAQAGRSSYLGNGYWKGVDYSQDTQYENISSLQVGAGNNAIKIDPALGQFWGGNKFEDARSRIDMNGNYIFKDSEGYDRILIGEKE